MNYIHNTEQKGGEINKNDVAASFQQAVIDVLSDHLMIAAKDAEVKNIALAGGVAANLPLRELIQKKAGKSGFKLYYPKPLLCTDNAAMIGCAAYYEYLAGVTADMSLNAYANMDIADPII